MNKSIIDIPNLGSVAKQDFILRIDGKEHLTKMSTFSINTDINGIEFISVTFEGYNLTQIQTQSKVQDFELGV